MIIKTTSDVIKYLSIDKKDNLSTHEIYIWQCNLFTFNDKEFLMFVNELTKAILVVNNVKRNTALSRMRGYFRRVWSVAIYGVETRLMNKYYRDLFKEFYAIETLNSSIQEYIEESIEYMKYILNDRIEMNDKDTEEYIMIEINQRLNDNILQKDINRTYPCNVFKDELLKVYN
ncbi:MAG: hypothetical protein LBM99_01260 [Bacillales bacterium]|jgi:hypothetical protein|nr:hypothetical protein [Bacillales bacterium]